MLPAGQARRGDHFSQLPSSSLTDCLAGLSFPLASSAAPHSSTPRSSEPGPFAAAVQIESAVTNCPEPTSALFHSCVRFGSHKRTVSIERGFGPKCWKHIAPAIAALDNTFTDAQVESAVEALEDGAVVPSIRPLLYFVVSTRGDENHLVNLIEDTCTCEAGRNDRACYHLAAAQVLDAAA